MSKQLGTTMRQLAGILSAAAMLVGIADVQAAVVGRAISPMGDLNLTTFNPDADGDSFPNADRDFDNINESFPTSLGDMFGLGRRGQFSVAGTQNPHSGGDPALDNIYPFALMDDSLTVFAGDPQGIIQGGTSGAITDSDPFFGVSDTVNDDATTVQSASWLFDVSGASGGLSVKIDMAAMGDFEATGTNADFFNFEFALDGGAFSPLFTSSINEDIMHTYTLESGTMTEFPDPVLMEGTVLSNIFQTFTANVGNATSTLTIRHSALTDGGTEAFAFRNILIEDNASAAGVLGDYNNNGTVDAADYVLWRDGGPLENEGDNPGTVNQADYDFWRSRFGATSGSGSALGNVAVPEPVSVALLLVGLAGLAFGRRGSRG